MKSVLDASAVLAFLGGEPGSDRVAAVLPDAIMSAVNGAEVYGKLADRGASLAQSDEIMGALALDLRPFDAAQARASAQLRGATRALGLSLGDRACLSLAQVENLPVLTADRVWADLDIGVEIEVIR